MMIYPESIGFFEIDHTADIAIAVTGNSLESLFLQSFKAIEKICDVKLGEKIKGESNLSLKANSNESLLVAFLNELIILIESDSWPVCTQLKILNNQIDFCFELFECNMTGNEIKAVTYNMMNIVEHSGFYSTIIVFDV